MGVECTDTAVENCTFIGRVGACLARSGGFGEAFRYRAGAEEVVMAPNDFFNGLLAAWRGRENPFLYI